jgi:hypothetical protein
MPRGMILPMSDGDQFETKMGNFEEVAGDLKEIVRFHCPFCLPTKLLVHAGTQDGMPALIHSLPICKEFDELDPDEFLHRARVRYSG